MTPQKPDKVFFEGDEYYLSGIDGINLPTPVFFGLSLAGWSTNCRRGYWATYQVTQAQRLVATFNLDSDHELTCQFTGGMLIGKNYVPETFGLFRPNGYVKPASYQTALELIFVGGTLKRVYDRSEIAAEIRARFTEFVDNNNPSAKDQSQYVDSLNLEFAASCGYAYKDLALVVEHLTKNSI